ncbi:MAG: hypothetical protein MPK62_00950 [Alphaproteobacteria bacterium]|nr:hypothetical protein [Alphaproteobacteria bacterium]MDA8029702.1 hypothetical protein [Alphaproteobacteria bacterium]
MIEDMLSILPALVLAIEYEGLANLGLSMAIVGIIMSVILAALSESRGALFGIGVLVVGLIMVAAFTASSETGVQNTTIIIDGKDVIPDTAGPEVIYDEYGIRILLEREGDVDVNLTIPGDLREPRTFENDKYRITVEPIGGSEFREVDP